MGNYMAKMPRSPMSKNFASTSTNNITAQNKSTEYMSSKSAINQNNLVYNTISEEAFKSVNYSKS